MYLNIILRRSVGVVATKYCGFPKVNLTVGCCLFGITDVHHNLTVNFSGYIRMTCAK